MIDFLNPFIEKGLGYLAFAALMWLIAQIAMWFRADLRALSDSLEKLAKSQAELKFTLERVLDVLDRRPRPTEERRQNERDNP